MKPLIRFKPSIREFWVGFRLSVIGGRADFHVCLLPFFPVQFTYYAADPMMRVGDFAMIRPNVHTLQLGVGEIFEIHQEDSDPLKKQYKLFFERNNRECWFHYWEVEPVDLQKLSEFRKQQ